MKNILSKVPAWNEKISYWLDHTWAEWFDAMPSHVSDGLTEHLIQDFPQYAVNWIRYRDQYTKTMRESWPGLPRSLKNILTRWYQTYAPTDGDPNTPYKPWDTEEGDIFPDALK